MSASPTLTPLGGGWFLIRDGTRQWRLAIAGSPDKRWAFVNGRVVRIAGAPAAASRRAAAHADEGVMAPMPATVVTIAAHAGQQVKRGETLLVLEAMKMELPVRAPRDGIVTAVHCALGDLVQPGVRLMEVE